MGKASKKDVLKAISNSAGELDSIISEIIAKTNELEDKKLPSDPCRIDTLPRAENSLEMFLVHPDDLSQVMNHYSIIQYGLHDKQRQFRDCQTVGEYLRDKEHEGKTFLILPDVTLFETEASEWLESLRKTPSLNAISVAVLSTNQKSDLEAVTKKFPTNVGVFQNPLKKQQIDHFRSLVSLPNQQFGS